MQWVEYPLTDMGYADADTGEPLETIDGLDNRSAGQRFVHRGYTYPAGATACLDSTDRASVLAVYLDDATPPEGGDAVAPEDVPALLVTDYGWPEGTSLGAGGLPVVPVREP
jgi:hypothetical protein